MANARLSVNINKETEKALNALADEHDTTVTEVVRRAVSVYKYFCDETREDRKQIQTIDETGKAITIRLI